jgi:hypothetical protein
MKGLILSGTYLEYNLAVEFGRIIPVELPLLNKTLLSHQLEVMKTFCDEIFLTIPSGYSLAIDEDIKVIEVDEKLTLIQVFQFISNLFNESSRIFIHYGDSLFINYKGFDTLKNSIFLQRPKFKYHWGLKNNLGEVPAGGFVLDISILRSLIMGVSDFDQFIQNIYSNDLIDSFSNFTWLDFGHTLTYYNSRKEFLESREFNRIETSDDGLIKSSKDIFKIWCEYKWLQWAKNIHPSNFPFTTDFQIYRSEASYKIEYINNPPLSDIFVFGKLNHDDFRLILLKLKEFLKKFQSKSSKTTNKGFPNLLTIKLEERKNEIFKIAKSLDFDLLFLNTLFNNNYDYFLNLESYVTHFHGDFCFSNIIFDFSSYEPIIIDPRGYISRDKGFENIGPGNYDIYKLAHSYVCGYDFIIAGYAESEFLTISEMKLRFVNFIEIFECDPLELKMGLINLFITMIPLHMNSTKRQKSFLEILYKIDTF